MRELIFKDVYSMSKILKKMEIKIDVDGKTQEQVGAEMILRIGENLHLAEKEVNNLLGDLIGMKGEEFANLPITKSIEYYEQFKKLPGINDFLQSVGQLMKQTV